MHIAFVLGTRPEIIKLASLLLACQREGLSFSVIHTNQHHMACMDRVFFEELGLPKPDFNLGIGSGSHADQTGRMLCAMAPILEQLRPDIVVVQGDTNSALAGGLAAAKLGIHVAHVEAGLRSHDRSMPEEINRVLLDHLATSLFCPTQTQADELRREGIDPGRIHVTGNTVADATLLHAETALRTSDILGRLGLRSGHYYLVTCHRRSNTDDPSHFEGLIRNVAELSAIAGVPLVFPAHPRIREHGHAVARRYPQLQVIDPLGYLDMLALLQGSALLMTDSGGLQEEACILRRKCLLLRTNTERPETLSVGGSEMPPALDAHTLRHAAKRLLEREVSWFNPFGDGDAYRRILSALQGQFGRPAACLT